ncbi:hypothetical protein DEU47_104705 [Bacillus sp. AG236]|nr:hypothetical protein DEU47_104705 [Bacillus sp. AG236]
MGKIITKKQAVELFGSEACKKHFEKYKKFTNKDLEKALIKEMKRYYTLVKIAKPQKGRGYVYELSAKKDVITVKEDGRSSNGAWSIPYTKNMDIIVVSALEKSSIPNNAQLLSKWCLDFCLITKEMYALLPAKYNEHYREQCLQKLKDNRVICEDEDRILNDFIYDTKVLQNQLAGTLKRLQKIDIIEYSPVYKGFIKEDGRTINLHENVVKKILLLQESLMDFHSVNDWYLRTYYNSKKAREYQEEWNRRLNQVKDVDGTLLGLNYWYTTYEIIPKARKGMIINYLEKYNKEVIEHFKIDEESFLRENEVTYHSKRNKYVVSNAQKREGKFLEPKVKPNLYVEEVGGKQVSYKPIKEDYTYNQAYYALYFNRLYAQRIKGLQEYYSSSFR